MPQARAAPELLSVSSARGRWVLTAVVLASGMAFLDGTVVNVAVPTIQRAFDTDLAGVQWVIDAYLVTLTAFILLGGSSGDLFGRRRVFVIGLMGFTVGSIACGLAPTVLTLIIARAVQGVGGALLVPGSLSILTVSFDRGERGRAIGIWSATSGIGAALGPVIGGILIDQFSWRWIFLINVPIAAVALWITIKHVPESRDEESTPKLDVPGAVSVAVGLAGSTYALIEGPSRGWGDPIVIAAAVLGVGGLVAFLLIERAGAQPMMPLEIFRNRNFAGTNVATLGIYFAISGVFLYLVLNIQQVQRQNALYAGAALIPATAIMLVGSPIAGRLSDRFGPRLLMTIGPCVAAAGLLIALGAGPGAGYVGVFFPSVVVFSIGLAITVAPLTTAALSSLETRHAGVASGVNNAVARLAGLLAVAILPALTLGSFSSALESRLPALDLPPGANAAIVADQGKQGGLEPPPGLSADQTSEVQVAVAEAFVAGYRLAIAVCAGLLVLGGVVAFLTIRMPGTGRKRTSAPEVVDAPGGSGGAR